LLSSNDRMCYYDEYNGTLRATSISFFRTQRLRVTNNQWISREDLFPLPYISHERDFWVRVEPRLYFPIDATKDQLCAAVFEKDLVKLKEIVEKHYNISVNTEGKFWMAFTSHPPESIAFFVFLKGNYNIIKFALKVFQIAKSILNQLRLGIHGRHPSEILIRRGEFKLLGKLINSHGLAFKGERIDSGLKFNLFYNPILTAIELGDNMLLAQALSFFKTKLPWKSQAREDGATPIQLAISNGRIDLLRTLIDAKAPVNDLGWCDLSPFQFASNLGSNEEILQLLLEKNANVDGK